MTPSHENLTAEVIKAIRTLKYSFFSCYKFQEERLLELVKLLQEAESRGILVTDAVSLAETSFWLQWIACNLTYVELLLQFAQNPGPKNLRALIQIHGPDRKRAKAQVTILDEQLQRRLSRFANMPPDEAFALIRDNRARSGWWPEKARRHEAQKAKGAAVTGFVIRISGVLTGGAQAPF